MKGSLGEIRLWTGNFIPENWLLCDGQTLPKAGYPDLFKLLKNLYGGDAENVGLPSVPAIGPQLVYIICVLGSNPQYLEGTVAEMRLYAGPASQPAPGNWLYCNGGSLLISSNQALYSLIGTNYGGDGVNNFQIPKLAPVPGISCIICMQGIFPSDGGQSLMEGYLSEVRLFAGTFQPNGWLYAQGALLPLLSPNFALFSLIGNTFGGDGIKDFALPRLAPLAGGVNPTQYIVCIDGIYPSRA